MNNLNAEMYVLARDHGTLIGDLIPFADIILLKSILNIQEHLIKICQEQAKK